ALLLVRPVDWRVVAVLAGIVPAHAVVVECEPRRKLRPVARSPEKGAETLVWLATSPHVADVSGVYFFDQEQRPPSLEAQDTETAGRLWEISERQCAVRSSARHKQAD